METAQLRYRPFTLEDAKAYAPLVQRADVLRYTGEKPAADLAAVEEILRTRPLADYQTYGYGRMACIEKTSGILVGFCGLKFLPEFGLADIGYRFVPEVWGRGYASESATFFVRYGLETLKLPSVIGFAMPENIASIKVLEKCGLRYVKDFTMPELEGTLKLYQSEVNEGASSV